MMALEEEHQDIDDSLSNMLGNGPLLLQSYMESRPYKEEIGSRIPKMFSPHKDIFFYTQNRQLGETCKKHIKNLSSVYVNRQLPGLLKEKEYSLGQINKVFASSWVSDRQVVFGTKCNKLIVMDLLTKQMARIPSMRSSDESKAAPCPCGIHAIATNPSKTLLATGAENTNDIAIYQLPTFDLVCVGECGHDDWIFDVKWLDDQFLVTGSRDSKLCLWRVEADSEYSCSDVSRSKCLQLPQYILTKPLAVKTCRNTQRVRALACNTFDQEIAVLSLDAYMHIWDAARFTQKFSFKLRHSSENVCMSKRPDSNLYAVGSQSHVTLVDPRMPKQIQAIQSIQRRVGIRSLNFNVDMLSIGTGNERIYFHDLRAMKYLELENGRPLFLKAGSGWLSRDNRDFHSDLVYPNAIFTHCYDDSGTRLFAAGGPLAADLHGNYAGLWY